MKPEIQIEIFPVPSGNVRGVATAMAPIAGKPPRRIAHATLTTDTPISISVDVPKRNLTPEDVRIIANGLLDFVAELEKVPPQ